MASAPVSILCTGGAGYVGSHTVVALQEAGFTPVILDNFANSNPAVLDRLQRILGTQPALERGGGRGAAGGGAGRRRRRPAGGGRGAGGGAGGGGGAGPRGGGH